MMEKHGPVKKKIIIISGTLHEWNILTGRSGEERPDAQVNRLATHACIHTYTILVPNVVPLRVLIVYLALRSMGPSTDNCKLV